MDVCCVNFKIHIRLSQEIYKDFLFQVPLLLVFQDFLIFKVHTRDYSVTTWLQIVEPYTLADTLVE